MAISKPEFSHLAFRWDSPLCWIEVRVSPGGLVTGHYYQHNGRLHDNMPGNLTEEGCRTLAIRALGVGDKRIDDLKDELWNAVKTLKSITRNEKSLDCIKRS